VPISLAATVFRKPGEWQAAAPSLPGPWGRQLKYGGELEHLALPALEAACIVRR
jgi:hypothetical protein